MDPAPGRRPVGVVIPIRAFHTGKARLADALDDDARAELAVDLATRVAAAAGNLPVVVVSSAPEVLAWTTARGLATVADPGDGLDDAATAGYDHLVAAGCRRVIVAHADLPRARPGALERFAPEPADVVTIVPCHRDDGTPVLSIPAARRFPFAYGPGSARRHAARARALGLAVRVVRDPDLGFDIDLPADLTSLPAATA